jgi:chemotaxis protein MotB
MRRDGSVWRGMRMAIGVAALLPLAGCVSASKYNQMIQERNALEASLRAEIDRDQVEIKELQDGIRVRMASELLYHEGSIELSPQGTHALDKIAGQLAQSASQGMQIDVVGNTDDVPIGPEIQACFPSNWELGAARASLVVRYLQHKGVSPSMLEAISNGQYHPVASNDTPAGRAKNRRTDLLMRPMQQQQQ